MKVFVAGTSGTIGRHLVPKLIEAGHEVIGSSPSAERLGGIEAMGARAVTVDALDRDATAAALEEAHHRR